MAQVIASTSAKRKKHLSSSLLEVQKKPKKRTFARHKPIGTITAKGVAPGESYEIELHKKLHNLSFASAYLSECLQDDDFGTFLIALKHVIDAHGGMLQLSHRAGLNRESLYKALSEEGNPRMQTILSVLQALNLRIDLVKVAEAKTS